MDNLYDYGELKLVSNKCKLMWCLIEVVVKNFGLLPLCSSSYDIMYEELLFAFIEKKH